jgi:hypothetical protein
MSFDIVIPVGPNDYNIISKTIDYTKRNVINYRNIYIVSSADFKVPGCITIHESTFPFTIDYIAKKVRCDQRAGWYLQQLIKLTAGNYIDGILDNYLVLDSDVYILKPTEFMQNNIPLFAYGNEHHLPYFDHMHRLHPSLSRQLDMSGICHHMLFTKKFVNELFQLVENNTGMIFIEAFLDNVTIIGPDTSGASEYEIYFNFMIHYHSDCIKIRSLKWSNLRKLCDASDEDFVAVHHYIRDD